MSQKQNRVTEFDFLKCILIVLVVFFHLTVIVGWEYQTKIVYTFHIPAFLMLSGYLTNVNKSASQFGKSVLVLFVPYAIFMTMYVTSLYLVSSILPTFNKINELSISYVLEKIFLKPTGTYWYLHTLIICNILYFIVYRIGNRFNLNNTTRLILLGLTFFVSGYFAGLVSLNNVLYYAIGVTLRQSRTDFLKFFKPSFWTIVPLIILCCFPQNLNRATIAGVIITYLAISFFLAVHNVVSGRCREFMNFIGRNTLVIYLLAPIFITVPRIISPYFKFDSSGILFLLVSTTFMISCCIAVAWITDKLHISKYLFCTNMALKK